MKLRELLPLDAEVEQLRLEPGDLLILRVPRLADPDDASSFVEAAKGLLPAGVSVLVMEGDASFATMAVEDLQAIVVADADARKRPA